MLSCAGVFATAWTIACKTPLSMGFPRQEYSSGLPIPSSGDPPGSGVRFSSPARQAGSLSLSHLICAVLCLAVQSCPTLHGPMDCSPPRSSVHRDSPGKNTDVGFHALLQGIFPSQGSNPGLPLCGQILYHLSYQGSPRILEWVTYPFSRGSSQARNQTGVSCIASGSFTS